MNKILLLSIVALFCSLNVSAADRPDVLIIGDSISLGYTPHVIELMLDEAKVVHNPGNAQHSTTGLEKIDAVHGGHEASFGRKRMIELIDAYLDWRTS